MKKLTLAVAAFSIAGFMGAATPASAQWESANDRDPNRELYNEVSEGMQNKYRDGRDRLNVELQENQSRRREILLSKWESLMRDGYLDGMDGDRFDDVDQGMRAKYGDDYDPNWSEGLTVDEINSKHSSLTRTGHIGGGRPEPEPHRGNREQPSSGTPSNTYCPNGRC